MLAGCAARSRPLRHRDRGEPRIRDLLDAVPDCFADLRELGYSDELAAQFPDFKRTELEPNGVAYAMPWDSGPVAMFYRRDHYENAGVGPATIQTWDDFIAAGRKIQEANPDVVMTQGDLNGDTEWFRMIANEQGCGYFSNDAQTITANQPGCVAALETIRKIYDADLMTAANWDEKIQSNNAGTVATQMYGAWYEGTIRSTAPEDQAGRWGVYPMPSITVEGSHAANLGGSALAISNTSDNKTATCAFLEHALGTNEG